MKLEAIAYTLSDAKLALSAGADRIEVISAPSEGGLTPSLGFVEELREQTSKDIRIMIRPHSRHFIYDADDASVLIRDAELLRNRAIDGLVFGALTPEGLVDESLLVKILEASGGLPITFHRAFDEIKDQEHALRTLSQYSEVTHILTSGGQSSALKAIDQIKKLQELATTLGTISILAGAGLTVEALPEFIRQTGVDEVHLGSGIRSASNILNPIDSRLVSAARLILNEEELARLT
ncbi:copper homeostasis protein [Paenibacillus shirakamiensis]|uniref:PF03932 family protein CutC n=1 Tax=Paenibacillus shirakamiensis TaxID=1265935 RepID=A0ABS4JJF0_9BACL|nr:copper homeostasis protein CutC [Paenibacillus shirakamiensis]MBP2001813.1 copper homeostasis protein [Paenibacillus shirakamiensis]